MYTRPNKISKKTQEIANYLEGADIYNSLLLVKLNEPGIERETYVISTHEYRPDLIADDFYGSSDYMGLLLLQCSRPLESFTKGSVLSLIKKSTLDSIVNSI